MCDIAVKVGQYQHKLKNYYGQIPASYGLKIIFAGGAVSSVNFVKSYRFFMIPFQGKIISCKIEI